MLDKLTPIGVAHILNSIKPQSSLFGKIPEIVR